MGLTTLLVLMKIQCSQKTVPITGPTFQNDFDWLRNINDLPRFVRPEMSTALVEPKSASAVIERRFIACFVISAPKNILARSAIRQTWGRLIKPIFLIAFKDNETMSLLSGESKAFNDIIVEDFVDSYSNLTIKTAFAMKYFVSHFADSKYFFKIDDDVFLNVHKLYEMLEHAPSDSLIGKLNRLSKPIRQPDSKFFVPRFLYPEDVFPPYFDGPAYIIPG